jgi:hypothetical protein
MSGCGLHAEVRMQKVIGLIDYDSRIPNLALMKLSAFYRGQGYVTHLNMLTPETAFRQTPEQVFCSVVYQKNRERARRLATLYPGIIMGGTGWDVRTELPPEVEVCHPDYGLYRAQDLAPRLGGIGTRSQKLAKAQVLITAGIGFTSRGCVRRCPFCEVPIKEGALRSVAAIGDLVNPASNILILLNNNLTAQANVLDELAEIKARGLRVDITQDIDIRLMTPEIAKALSEVSHIRSIHYAWDLMAFERQVWRGIGILSQYIRKYRHLCFMLVGFNTTFEEDRYRFANLMADRIDPYVMLYNDCTDLRLRHFARWVNARFCTVAPFDRYTPWVRDREAYFQQRLGVAAA